MRTLLRSKLMLALTGVLMIAVIALPLALNAASSYAAHAASAHPTFAARGGLDCNGYSNIQKPRQAQFALPGFRWL